MLSPEEDEDERRGESIRNEKGEMDVDFALTLQCYLGD